MEEPLRERAPPAMGAGLGGPQEMVEEPLTDNIGSHHENDDDEEYGAVVLRRRKKRMY